jgi:tRNA-splicing ligase RtcB (3'-phosphate/5'-hydroxy nucleic acid ligase)
MRITGKTLIAWGYKPGPWFPAGIAAAERASQQGADENGIRAAIDAVAPSPLPPAVPLRPSGALGFRMNIRAGDAAEAENIAAVERHMAVLMRVPTIRAGAVMPDACPAGAPPGTIPVGGIVAAEEAIHPGMHSSDICCSMALSVFSAVDPTKVLDAGMKLSHFGGGGRPHSEDLRPSDALLKQFENNRLLRTMTEAAIAHFGTQGDGNHFFYVGRLASSGDIALVTHHGSRKPGALLYKLGMEIAERWRRDLSPETPPHNAWIPSETDDGRDYWDALQIIRTWTKNNHFAIHDAVAKHLSLKVKDRFWNEHNFVFRKTDGLFYHAKGATPAFPHYADDATGLTLIPLNMAEPILITRGLDARNGLGFAPHGAGRNFSRTAFMKRYAHMTAAQIVAEQTRGIDARYFCGIPDVSELPGAYKNAATVRRQIIEYGLAKVVDTIMPVGNIMAGDWQHDAPWRKKRRGKPAPSS